MKKLILISALLFTISGCGPSQKEKENIAGMACAEIMVTQDFEEARRIRIINEARLEVGLEPITASGLFEANIRLGGRSSCIDYIIPPPPKTRRQIAAEKAAAEERAEAEKAASEAARLKREEEERIAAEEKKYIVENTNTTYLACPSLEREGEWKAIVPNQNKGMYQPNPGAPVSHAYIELNKVEGDNPDLNGYITSTAYWGITSSVSQGCSNTLEQGTNTNSVLFYDAFAQGIYPDNWCLGEFMTAKVEDYISPDGLKKIAWTKKEMWGSMTSSQKVFIIDRASLRVEMNYKYQCEIVTKDTFDENIEEAKTRVKAEFDKYQAEKAAEEAITKKIEPQI